MSNDTAIQKTGSNPIVAIRNYLDDGKIQKTLQDMLGESAGVFRTSIINLMNASPTLQKCTQQSLRHAIMTAAAVKLPMDPILGMAAIVPYKKGRDLYLAQFQLMYRGVIQLCIRSGQYKHINCTEVYEDEIDFYNPITGEVAFKDPKTYKIRYEPERDKHVAGHYIYFELLTGFKHSGYISCKEAMAHAERYSKAYQYDLKEKKATSAWSTNPIEMGNKTIILRELKRYGIMSIDLQQAIVKDESYDTVQAESAVVIEEDAGSEPLDPKFEGNAESAQNEEMPDPKDEPSEEQKKKIAEQKAALKNAGDKSKRKRRTKAEMEADRKAQEQQPPTENMVEEGQYVCRKCGVHFSESEMIWKDKPGGGQYPACPCGSIGFDDVNEIPR